MNYCPKCGKRIDGDCNYCPSCGASFERVSESSVSQSQMYEDQNTVYMSGFYKEYSNLYFVMPLLCVIADFVFLIIGNALMYDMSEGFAWTMIITYILATVGCVVGLIANIKAMRRGVKGKAIAGLVLSIVGLSAGSIFFIGAIIGLIGY